MLVVGLLVVAGIVLASQMMGNKPAPENTLESGNMVEASASPVGSPALDATTMEEQGDAAVSGMVEDDVKVIEMEAGAFYYEPSTIEVKKGQKVRVVFKSVDMMHDFNVDELKIKSEIVKSGSTSTFEFTADQVGKFEYYCSVGQHRQNGQIGTLIVTEQNQVN